VAWPPLVDGRLFQLGYVVRDLDEALPRYTEMVGGAPWRCFTFSAAIHEECRYRGASTDFSVRLALTSTSPQLELVQPLVGPSIHEDWLRDHGEGFHHVGLIVDSVATATERMARAGLQPIQDGRGFGAEGDGVYALFDTFDVLGAIVEVLEPPARMPEPDAVWTP
jgi:hypothetical protein